MTLFGIKIVQIGLSRIGQTTSTSLNPVQKRNIKPNHQIINQLIDQNHFILQICMLQQGTTDLQKPEKQYIFKGRLLYKLILGIIIIITTSFQVYQTSVHTFNHSRQIIRSLNYYILEHTDFDIYWAGQGLLNYPINEYFLLQDLNSFFARLQQKFSNFDSIMYGMVDQKLLNESSQSLLILRKNGSIENYEWTIEQGISQPFQVNDLDSIKRTLLDCEYIRIPLSEITLEEHIWNIYFQIEPYSSASTIVQIFAEQQISLLEEHIITSLFGFILLIVLIYQHQLTIQYYDMPDYMLAGMLILTGCLSATELPAQTLNVLDGITCLLAYLWILKFYTRQQDYHISILIRRSYVFVGKLFISFGPVFIAFVLMAYTCFSRYSGQFKSVWRTFLSLFYISYYNMTYQSMIVTSRANPISVIFFVTFVILFTICVYSAMLVSIFCSYVWGKRQEKIKKDILENLNIKCSSCNHKYKYSQNIKKQSINPLSEIRNYNFRNVDEAFRYKKSNSCQKIQGYFKQIDAIYKAIKPSIALNNCFREECWKQTRKVQIILKELQNFEKII